MINSKDFEPVEVETIKTNKKIEYINLESGFDIETTSCYVDGEKSAFMYIWMFGLGYDNNIYYGRTWEEFKDLCVFLQEYYNLSEHKRLIIYVHNLSYEFQFMRKHFQWENVFAVGERKPIKALCSYGIEFRDSYILSGYSLEKTADNLNTYKVDKMVGDLDYSKIRHNKTKLTNKEKKYCENDVKVILAYIKEQINQYKDITKIPLTNTSRVRSYVRNNCYYTNTNHRKSSSGKYYRYRTIMGDLTLEPELYIQLKRAFMGGYTHANANYVGQVLEDVTSIDFTSSYPSTMLSEKFPMSRGKKIKVESVKELEELGSKYCLLFDIRLEGIRCKINQENYISESKCIELVKPIINNGRVYSADMLSTTITDVDYVIIKKCYEWDSISVSNVTRFHKGYLPKAIIESVLELYQKKTELKGVNGSEVEYLLSKGMLNSVYGMSVTDIVKDNQKYDNGWYEEKVLVSDEIDKYNESKNRFLYYPWGVWITAYSRRNLWTGIFALGDDYVYSDTDSIKLLNYENHQDYINWYNDSVLGKIYLMMNHYNLDSKLISPKTIEGVEKPIGVWDYEGTFTKFKTLGAKRYLEQDKDKYILTCAGLSKVNGMNYIINKCDNDSNKIFNMFNDELYIPSDNTGKMTHTYIDEYMEYNIEDYKGDTEWIKVESGIHLEPCDFTLSISKQYGKFIKNLIDGYLYKGVKTI